MSCVVASLLYIQSSKKETVCRHWGIPLLWALAKVQGPVKAVCEVTLQNYDKPFYGRAGLASIGCLLPLECPLDSKTISEDVLSDI